MSDELRAALNGAIAACKGLPLSKVADSGYRARSLCGDAWERGWQYAAEQFSSLSDVGVGISRGCQMSRDGDDEKLGAGVCYRDDTVTVEILDYHRGELMLAYTLYGESWKLCVVRRWKKPDSPTRYDVRCLLDVLGVNPPT